MRRLKENNQVFVIHRFIETPMQNCSFNGKKIEKSSYSVNFSLKRFGKVTKLRGRVGKLAESQNSAMLKKNIRQSKA